MLEYFEATPVQDKPEAVLIENTNTPDTNLELNVSHLLRDASETGLNIDFIRPNLAGNLPEVELTRIMGGGDPKTGKLFARPQLNLEVIMVDSKSENRPERLRPDTFKQALRMIDELKPKVIECARDLQDKVIPALQALT